MYVRTYVFIFLFRVSCFLIYVSWAWLRCELFDQNLKLALEVAEKAGTFGPGS